MPETGAIAVIPARAGSSRIPNKNVQSFHGHPMLAYSVAAAMSADVFDHVLVSTDSQEYGAVARHYGAEFVQRPAEFATHTAGLVGTALHAVDHVASSGTKVTNVCVLMPVCPLRRAASIRTHYHRFAEKRRTFQLSVMPYRFVQSQWALTRDADGLTAPYWGHDELKRSQLLDPVVCPSGAIWLANVQALYEQQTFYGSPLHTELIDFVEGIDIDEPEDFELALDIAAGRAARLGHPALEPIVAKPWSTR